jgi:hypothetical protein
MKPEGHPMAKGVAVILIGLVILSLFSIVAGQRVFPPAERNLYRGGEVQSEHLKEKSDLRKIRLAFSSFDLVAGLTNHELETLPTNDQTFFFLYLLACLWLLWGLKKAPRQ